MDFCKVSRLDGQDDFGIAKPALDTWFRGGHRLKPCCLESIPWTPCFR
jgi:hypothetical protein